MINRYIVGLIMRQHFLMCGCSTFMLPLTDCRHPRPSSKPTTGKLIKNVASTKNEFGKSKVPALRHWSSPSSTGATGRISEAFLKRLASLLSDKRNATYSETMAWLRCRLSFALLRANVLCLRGTRGRERPAETTSCATVALAEAQVSWH